MPKYGYDMLSRTSYSLYRTPFSIFVVQFLELLEQSAGKRHWRYELERAAPVIVIRDSDVNSLGE
jgi:hypothetical protein